MKLLILSCLFLSFASFAAEPTVQPIVKPTVKTVKLTTKNHVLLRGTVSNESVSRLGTELLKLSTNLDKSETIYLVIDSGGGGVLAGMDLLNIMDIIPQKIHTVSFYAFSMAYSISQRGDKRFITQRGIMGQHRAKGGFQGQFASGEVEKRLKLFTDIIHDLERFEANRMGISFEGFQDLIKDEMYVYGKQAVDKKVADGVMNVSCSEELINTRVKEKQCSMFGCSDVEFSACPLIKAKLPVIKKNKE